MIEKHIKLKQLLQIDYLNKYPDNLNLRMEMRWQIDLVLLNKIDEKGNKIQDLIKTCFKRKKINYLKKSSINAFNLFIFDSIHERTKLN